jgi:hypothetical protein
VSFGNTVLAIIESLPVSKTILFVFWFYALVIVKKFTNNAIRASAAGAVDEDRDLIGSVFHR